MAVQRRRKADTGAAETGKTESRPDLTGAEPVVLSNRPACPLRVVGLGCSQKEEAILGVVGCEEGLVSTL